VLVTGTEKAEALRRALDPATSVHDVPARLVRERDWLVDTEAAGTAS
jgi:6-phosphogluconolactonase/glucosamine-6-phosphate isomerase/deaminase